MPARTQTQAQHLAYLWCVSFLSCCWESVSLPTRWLCREEDDGLPGHEAAEISALTLLRRESLCRWKELRSPLKSAMRCRRPYGLPPSAERIVKTATLKGGRCSFDPSPCEEGTLSFRSTFLQIFDIVPFLF